LREGEKLTKIAVIQFPGSNCDYDTHYALEEVIGCNSDIVWYKKSNIDEYDGIVVPGGFSYGDYLRAGSIAARTPMAKSIVKEIEKGKPVLGICNGFQILTELNILPGALMLNEYPRFVCKDVKLKVESNNSLFTRKFDEGEKIDLPIAHKEGNYYASESTTRKLLDSGRAALRYTDEEGRPNAEFNPNGSVGDIAAVLNRKGNVLGMMPHPERAAEEILGSSDGAKILEGMVESASKV